MSIDQLNFLIAFQAGLISFLAPCLLPLLPSYFAVISGFTFKDLYGLNFAKIRGRVFVSSLFFVFGFVIFFSLMGASATLLGRFLSEQLDLSIRLAGFFLVYLGLIQVGVIHFGSLRFDYAWRVQKRLAGLGYLTALVTGIVAGLVWVPCIGPVLAPILFLASRAGSATYGLTLLLVFSLGLTTPFLLLGLLFPTAFRFLQKYRRLLHFFSVLAGIIVILFGLILITGHYQSLLAISRIGLVQVGFLP